MSLDSDRASSRAPAVAAISSGAATKGGAAAKGGAGARGQQQRPGKASSLSMGMHMAQLAGSPPRAFGTDCTSVMTPNEAPPPSSGK